MDAAQVAERAKTLILSNEVIQDFLGNISIMGRLDMHWHQHGSGCSYNSGGDASYFMDIFTHIIMSAWVFCKSCRVCFEFAKKKREGEVNQNV
eukprot:2042976-Ditylum_brightwellii.AAC.1